MTDFNTTYVESLSDFVKQLEERIVDNYRITLFRGQPTDKALIPKIARNYFKKSRELDEIRMFLDFNIQSVQYLSFKPRNDIERLTIAQHHGLPTRLLDWTENALAALYFAVSEQIEKNDNAVVWVLSVERESSMLINNLEIEIFNQSEIKLFKPSSIIPRVTSQFGWFSCHPYLNQGQYERIDKKHNDNTRLSKVIIKKEKAKKILSTLESCGINRHSIFRDLDSLGEFIFEKYKKG